MAAEAYKHAESGIRVSAIPIDDLRVGVISDASWGNAKGEKVLETSSNDWWEESSTTWTRHHIDPRSTLFHPAASWDGPDLHDLMPTRRTIYKDKDYIDNWTTPAGVSSTEHKDWTGKTVFEKQPNGTKLSHDNINELFLQLLNTSSQGGAITMYYDKKLETSHDPQKVTIASWKSTRLKRKTVNNPFSRMPSYGIRRWQCTLASIFVSGGTWSSPLWWRLGTSTCRCSICFGDRFQVIVWLPA